MKRWKGGEDEEEEEAPTTAAAAAGGGEWVPLHPPIVFFLTRACVHAHAVRPSRFLSFVLFSRRWRCLRFVSHSLCPWNCSFFPSTFSFSLKSGGGGGMWGEVG